MYSYKNPLKNLEQLLHGSTGSPTGTPESVQHEVDKIRYSLMMETDLADGSLERHIRYLQHALVWLMDNLPSIDGVLLFAGGFFLFYCPSLCTLLR